MTIRRGDVFRKYGDRRRRTYTVAAVRAGFVGVRAHEFDALEWWEKERFDFARWSRAHGRTRVNFSGHRVPQTIFVRA